ncbi:hypothetical protein PG993_012423 [Apiospora rasikravindrae]|uniref:Nephrocystin 3-like N-terminal domain-containing protein n=1 Tax=Apiospora rasikravindrae TaxID=990691 RepID=A0ABR1S2C3_9PEZI
MRKLNLLPTPKADTGRGSRSVFWPRDLLPTTVPHARVMTYGYDSHIRHRFGPEGSQSTVYDIAWDFLVALEASRRSDPERSILLIAHSLGGIVVKEMLRKSTTCGQSHLRPVFASMLGVIFFGTPHGGADPRSFLKTVAEHLLRATGFTVNQQIADTLLPSSERLRELRDEFAPMARQRGWAIHSFQEQMGVKGLNGGKVVEDTSSYLNAPDLEVTEHICQNHMEMCRFVGSHDPEYRKVAAAISRIMKNGFKATTEPDHVTEPNVDPMALKEIMELLRFDQDDARHQNIKSAHAKTCKWLLKCEMYSDWVRSKHLEDNHGFFWMKGKPGTGKSTIMKFLLANARRTMKDTVVISFFFNARGHALERSTIGMYRSLLLQLLEKKPSLQPLLGLDSLRNRDALSWSLELLKSLFEQAVQSLASTPVACFIDALDECPETEVREMVSSFSHLGQLAVSAGYQFKVCFSSRHYPHVTIDKKIELVLEEQDGHGDDITHYVASELNIGQTKMADEVKLAVQTKSSGIFMWVVLVVQILNKEYDCGNIHRLRRRLKEIPEDLHELFRDILTRDAKNGDELILCLQWVLFAKTPLGPSELYFAVLSGVDPEALRESDVEELSDSVFDRYILNCSKGLIETTKSKSHTAQFIHESVRDFLLKDDGFQFILAKHIAQSFEGLSHEKLKQCCLVQIETATLEKDPGLSLMRFPFLRYAVDNILHHANKAGELGLNQSGFVANFQTADWVGLTNSYEKYQTRKYPPDTRLLYVLAEKNLSHLLSCLLTTHSTDSCCLEMGKERYSCPLYASLAMGSHETAKVLLRQVVDRFPASHEAHSHFEDLFSQENPWSPFPRDFKFHKKDELYEKMLRSSEVLMLLFLNLGLISEGDMQTHGPNLFMIAAERRHDLLAVEILKRTGTNHIGMWEESPLHTAVRHGLATVTGLLLRTLKEVNPRDKDGLTPLLAATTYNEEGVAKLLIDSTKTEVDTRDRNEQTPLSIASSAGMMEVVKLLLASGKADINSRDNDGQTPLFHAAISGSEGITELLLASNEVEVDARDIMGKTPLSYAAQQKREGIVKLLLDSGKVDVNSRDVQGRSPLSHAVLDGDDKVMELLLASEMVDINCRDNEGKTPLTWLVSKRLGGFDYQKKNMSLMLESGKIDVNSRDNEGRTCLSYAADHGYEWAVDMLLASGAAEVDSLDNQGRTPLSWATGMSNQTRILRLTGSEMDNLRRTVKMLTDRDRGQANVNARDYLGRTPLAWALTPGTSNEARYRSGMLPEVRVVRLLLEVGADPAIADSEGYTPLNRLNSFAQDYVGSQMDHYKLPAIRNLLRPNNVGVQAV